MYRFLINSPNCNKNNEERALAGAGPFFLSPLIITKYSFKVGNNPH